MTISLKQILARLTPARRKKIEARFQELSEEIQIRMLRKAGCECSKPLLGWLPIKEVPRCRLCNTVAEQPGKISPADADWRKGRTDSGSEM